MWTNFADNGKIHTCMYNVCTMYVQCIPRQLAWFHHGSWRVVCTEMNTIFGATFVGHCMYNVCTLYVRAMKVSQWLTEVYRERWFVEVFCSLRSHGTRLSLARQSNPCLVMERQFVRAIRSLYVTKLVTYNVLCQCLTALIANVQSEHLFDCYA